MAGERQPSICVHQFGISLLATTPPVCLQVWEDKAPRDIDWRIAGSSKVHIKATWFDRGRAGIPEVVDCVLRYKATTTSTCIPSLRDLRKVPLH